MHDARAVNLFHLQFCLTCEAFSSLKVHKVIGQEVGFTLGSDDYTVKLIRVKVGDVAFDLVTTRRVRL